MSRLSSALKGGSPEIKEDFFPSSPHLPSCMGYELLKINSSYSCLQEILAARALVAQDLSEELVLTDFKNAVVDTVLGKLDFLRQVFEKTVVVGRGSHNK